MHKDTYGLKEIVEVSKKYLTAELGAEEFCQYIFEEIFRKKLGYMNTDWNSVFIDIKTFFLILFRG